MRSVRGEPSVQSTSSLGYGPRIALLSPYGGGNLGDAAIQDSMIANLRIRLPNARFSGVSLSNENYLTRHGSDAYPLCALSGPFWGMSDSQNPDVRVPVDSMPRRNGLSKRVRSGLHRVPGLTRIFRAIKSRFSALKTERRHWHGAYRFIQGHSLLVICGGGQLDEEWGGAWGHPYALFKWTLLSKFARIPCAMVSVGACKVQSRLSRLFLTKAIGFSAYRSYRDENSKQIASSLLRRAAKDPVVPDLAFCLPESEVPTPANLRSLANGRKIVAISPIVYGKPGVWPSPDPAVFDRYLVEMTAVVSRLIESDYFIVFVWSGSSDQYLIAEIVGRVGGDLTARLGKQTYVAPIKQWRDLVAILQSANALIASRLHSTLLGFLARIPVIAISFDKKVDWAMRDLQQEEALFQIRDFTASQILEAVHSIEARRDRIVQELSLGRRNALQASTRQIDELTRLISAGMRS